MKNWWEKLVTFRDRLPVGDAGSTGDELSVFEFEDKVDARSVSESSRWRESVTRVWLVVIVTFLSFSYLLS